MKHNKALLLLLACSFSLYAQKGKDKKIKPRDEFVPELMAKMTIDEKIAQLVQYTADGTVTGPKAGINYIEEIKKGNVGSILNATSVKYTQELQELNLKNSRLKIPLLFGYDVIHGYKTIFPITLGETASWDLEAAELSARIAAEEASASGVHWTFAPMVDISRDPRWGRVSEGAGEDTYLGSQMAKARVKGFQGTDLSLNTTILACTKHFAAYGAAEAGRDYNTVDMSERTLREVYLPPFKATVDAGVGTFMTSFNEIAGVPATGSKFLLRDILKNEWGFNGFVVTDYTAINELIPHGVAKDSAQAGELAMRAGVDMDMVGGIYMKNLKNLLKEGKVTEEQINDACRRVLEAKYDLGLFHDPYRYNDKKREKEVINKKEYLDAALAIANKSMVLLKNDKNVLPLRKEQKVAFVGPLVSDEWNIIGSWAASGDRYGYAVSVEEGINKIISDKSKVTFDKGVEILKDDRSMMQAAINNARKADVIVAVMGEFENMSGEAASRTNIDLPGIQKEFLAELKKLNKPIILVLMNGRPLNLTWENDNMDAIIEAWFPGTMGGDAIAQTLYGMNVPSGKLPMTFPRNVGQVPIYYNHKNTGRPYLGEKDPEQKYKSRYIDVDNSPLFPFGYGLSYTTFQYSNLKLSSNTMNMNGSIKISVDITNTGNYDGEEVVQLYVQDKVGSVTRPVKELKGFEKVMIKKGEKKTVTFTITPENLKFYNIDMIFTAEPGDFEVTVGSNSADGLQDKFVLVK
ncbi:beta-glucosidase BglX [Flavobacterium salilacus subsp. salilacus]|uniref:beta-glucosidase BglX n=1 Tax=Flavobacterium TaxID=237 RepID=UPI001074D2AA|nr:MULTISPECIES: beta-glucosidase BglX [Flavobacterium]KAF2519985.1 beta-glucosidase BglX [Flavobacterium salilacus subsp. salilacus]MBE1614102.1 beta-glucosidase BglX [Flavobacterium sp. SaA2.13]